MLKSLPVWLCEKRAHDELILKAGLATPQHIYFRATTFFQAPNDNFLDEDGHPSDYGRY